MDGELPERDPLTLRRALNDGRQFLGLKHALPHEQLPQGARAKRTLDTDHPSFAKMDPVTAAGRRTSTFFEFERARDLLPEDDPQQVSEGGRFQRPRELHQHPVHQPLAVGQVLESTTGWVLQSASTKAPKYIPQARSLLPG